MFDRHSRLSQHASIASSAVLFVMAAALTSPSLAAGSTRLDCPDATRATLQVPEGAFITALVSHNIPAASVADDKTNAAIEKLETASANSLLVPRAEAAIRNAFSASERSSPIVGAETNPEIASDDDDAVQIDAPMNTRLPGISDEDFARYKKRMYRRDI